jgi:riboflavin synthase
VSLIPETLTATTLGDRAPGDRVNIETDILARHVERMLALEPSLRERPSLTERQTLTERSAS